MTLAGMLRISTVVAYATAVGLALGLIHLGAPTWLAVLLGIALPLAVHAVPLAIEFVTGAIIDRRPVARLGAWGLTRVWLHETRRVPRVQHRPALARRLCRVRDRAGLARPAVLFIHGYMCNRATWRPWLIERGLAQRWNCATINLEPVYAPVHSYTESVHAAVERLRRATGAERITLVCHSMGGLVARAYLRAHGHHAVARVVTIDYASSRHTVRTLRQGAQHAPDAARLRFVRRLAESDEPVEFVCFASQHDNLIVPRDNQVLECAESIWFERIGHLAMTDNDEVLAKLIEVVERPLPEAHAPGTRETAAAASS